MAFRRDKGIGPTAQNKIRNGKRRKKYCRFKRSGIKYIDFFQGPFSVFSSLHQTNLLSM